MMIISEEFTKPITENSYHVDSTGQPLQHNTVDTLPPSGKAGILECLINGLNSGRFFAM